MLDHLKDLRTQFAEQGRSERSSNAYIAVIVESSKEKDLKLLTLGPGPCHGSLQYQSLPYQLLDHQRVKYVLSQVQKLLVDKSDAEKYIEWLVQRSPWNEVFLTKDVQDILTYGYVARTDLPNNLVAGAFVASRFITESYTKDVVKRFSVYKEMIAAGASETEAYLFAHTYSSEHQKKLYPMLVQPLSSGHTALDVAGKTKDYFKRFVTASPHYAGPNFADKKGYENKIYATWGSSEGNSFTKFCSKLKPRSGKETTNYNIFYKPKTFSYYVNNRDELKDVLAQIKEQLYA